MKHYVYKLTDKTTNEYYFGSRTCKCNIEDDGYMGSMVTWKPNKNNLIKEVIKSDFKDRQSAIEFESELITNFIKDTLNRNYFIPTREVGFYGHTHSEQTKLKTANTMSGKHAGKNNPFFGKTHSEQTIKKMSNSLIGKTHSDSTKKKMSESASNIDRSNYKLNRKKVMYIKTGEIFDSMYKAAKYLGIGRSTIRNNMGTQFKLIN
jgi:group I intron endonuclease